MARQESAVTTAIVATDNGGELERTLEEGETLEYLEGLRVYIVHGIENARLSERVGTYRRLRHVRAAMRDLVMEPATFTFDELGLEETDFWWLDSDHMDAFSAASVAMGWDVRRPSSGGEPVGVIDDGIGLYDGTTYTAHNDLGSRQLGANSVNNPVVEETVPGIAGGQNYHGTQVASQVGATGNNTKCTIGGSWWGTPLVPIKFTENSPLASAMYRGLNWGLTQRNIKIFVFWWNYAWDYWTFPEDVESFFPIVNDAMEDYDAVIFWAQNNGQEPESLDYADQPYIVWTGSTDYAGYPSSNSPPNVELDCRAAVGEFADTNDAHETLVCTQSGDLTIFSTGNSLAAPVAAGLAATLWDMLPSGLADAERRDKVIDIVQRTCTKVFEEDEDPDPDNWGQINFLNAFGRPPSSGSVVTGTGSLTLTNLWRDEGTGSTVTSDQGIPGTLRLKVETVHPCPFDQTTIDGMDIRLRIGASFSTTASVWLKDDGGNFDQVGTINVGTGDVLSELYLVNGVNGFDADEYVDGSGDITMRVYVVGPLILEYNATFDQVLIRTLRASEEE